MYRKLNPSNLEAFLKYFASRVGKNFDDATIANWLQLEEYQRDQRLDQLMDHFGYTTDFEKNQIIDDFLQRQNSNASVRSEFVSNSDMVTEESNPLYAEKEVKKKKGGKVGWFFLMIFLLSVIAGAAYLWSKYSEYSNRSQVYCLANNLSVRKDLASTEKYPTRMDLFGKYRDRAGNIVTTYSSLPLVDMDKYNEYYKVYMDTSFYQYLMDGESSVGYVHSSYVTTRESEYERYREVFQQFRNDYNEMDQLQAIYRRILVNAIYNYSELQGQVLSPPCYKEPMTKVTAPRTIGTIKVKNGAAVEYIVVARIGGLYYTIHSNADATEIYVDKSRYKTQAGVDYLSQAGKFEYTTGAGNYPGLKWTNCDKSVTAYCKSKPFLEFADAKLMAPVAVDTTASFQSDIDPEDASSPISNPDETE